jgi:hypothetical protein
MQTSSLEGLARGIPKDIQAAKVRRVRAHTSLYISRKVARVLQKIATETGRDKVHDVMLEAVDDVLRKYGKPSIRAIDAWLVAPRAHATGSDEQLFGTE